MTQSQLLNYIADLGLALMGSGAEIYRVEESIRRIFAAYEEPTGEAFAIPNCLIVSIGGGDNPTTRMRRVGSNGIDIALLESLNALCRRICAETPDYPTARQWLAEAQNTRYQYSLAGQLVGYMLGTGAFALFFGGSLLDALFAALAGVLMCFALRSMRRSGGSFFIRTVVGGIIAGMVALFAVTLVPACNIESITIGAIMVLVPGLLMTGGVRDIMMGDTMSGISKLCEALLTATAIALGVGVLLGLSSFWGLTVGGTSHAAYLLPFWLKSIYALVACGGFCILYNIRGFGLFVCALGGALGTAVAALLGISYGPIISSFFAAISISLYAEFMARVRKCPVTGYQFVALFPLVPGGGIYYTMSAAIDGNLDLAGSLGAETLGIAGALSVGLLLVSAVVRMILTKKSR